MNRFDTLAEGNESGRSTIAWLTAVAAIGGLALTQGYVTDALYGEEKAVQLVEDMGLSDVEITDIDRTAVGYSICGPLDSVKYELSATNPQGNTVDATICKGLFTEASVYSGL